MAKSDQQKKSEASVDWITVTATTRKKGNALLDIYSRYKRGRTQNTKFFGFECLRDENGLTWGQRPRDGRYIYIAAGGIARETWRKVVPVAAKVTRLDLACDVWLDVPRDQVRQSSRLVLSPSLDALTKYVFITGAKGKGRKSTGETLYVGARTSLQYGRFYDKGLQQGTAEKGKWLRYEVEYKQAAALQVAKQALCLSAGQLGEWISCTVYGWFVDRYVVPAFEPKTDTPGLIVRTQMKQTTDEKKLAWLSAQVRPTLTYLFEQGLGDRALGALGLELVEIEVDGYNNDLTVVQPKLIKAN